MERYFALLNVYDTLDDMKLTLRDSRSHLVLFLRLQQQVQKVKITGKRNTKVCKVNYLVTNGREIIQFDKVTFVVWKT